MPANRKKAERLADEIQALHHYFEEKLDVRAAGFNPSP
jgi:hypothetical protein